MFQRTFRTKNLQRFVCVLLIAILLMGLFPISAFASEFAGIVPLAIPIAWGTVGPDSSFAPWTLYDNGTVEVGSGTVRGMGDAWLTEASTSPWHDYRNQVERIIFTVPVDAVGNLSGLFASLPFLYEIENLGYLNIDTAGPQVWMSNMFRGPNSLVSLDLSGWDVSNVTRFRNMFRDAAFLETIIGIEYWETDSLHTMPHMCRGASSLTSLDLSRWNTSGVTTGTDPADNGMASAFRDMTSLRSLNLSGWNTMNPALGSNGMPNMFTGSNALRELTLGTGWFTTGNPNLTNPPSNATYTGLWTNVGSGSIYAPEGTHTLTAAQLMDNASAPFRPDTWIWARHYPLLLVTFTPAGNGTVTPSLTGTEPNTTINPALPIYPAPNAGYQFSHWTSSDPTHGGGSFQTYQLHDLIITRDTTFTAYFTSLSSGTHLVTFLLNGGYVDGYPDPHMVTIPDSNPITEANVPVPTRPGYTFLGWKENGAAPLLTRPQVSALIVTTPRTFVAQWMPNRPGEPWIPGPEPTPLERQAYLIGTSDGLIRPNANITRAEVATIFFRLITDEARAAYWMQENPYHDVELQNWFNNAVSTMTHAGVFTGFPDGTFAPNQSITRAEMTAVVVRFIERMDGVNLLGDHFSDISDHWAVEYINTAAVNGWVQGYSDGTFRPNQAITRAETAAMINRLSGRLIERAEDLLPDMQTWPDNANVNAWYYLYIQSATNSYRFTWRGTGNAFERWVTIIPARNWAVLERLESRPEDILRP